MYEKRLHRPHLFPLITALAAVFVIRQLVLFRSPRRRDFERPRPNLNPNRVFTDQDSLAGRTPEQCLSSRQEIPLFLEHVPKTGTSFLNTLYRWGCGVSPENHTFSVSPSRFDPLSQKMLPLTLKRVPECRGRLYLDPGNELMPNNLPFHGLAGARPDNRDPHEAVPVVRGQVHHVVQMFREPHERIVSNFEYRQILDNVDPCTQENAKDCLSRKQEAFRKYVSVRGGQHMQLKATAGWYCRDMNTAPPGRLLRIASARLERYGFVGLTDRFDESVVLFHLKFGGCPEQSQFENMRPTNYSVFQPDAPNPSNAYHTKDFVAAEEIQLVQLARLKFETDAVKYGLYDLRRNPWYHFLYTRRLSDRSSTTAQGSN